MTIRLQFEYTNHRGDTDTRTITPTGILRCIVLLPWYPVKTWLMRGWCHDRKEYRDFQVSKMQNIRELDE